MKYEVRGIVSVSAWTEVEADSKEEALEIAKGRETGNLAHRAIYPDVDECWHFGSDGEPQKITLEN